MPLWRRLVRAPLSSQRKVSFAAGRQRTEESEGNEGNEERTKAVILRLESLTTGPIQPQLAQPISDLRHVPHLHAAQLYADGQVATIRTDRQRHGAWGKGEQHLQGARVP